MGRFTVRLPDTLHHQLELRAKQEGVSLNQYVVYALTQNVTPAYTIQVLPDADILEHRERLDALLEQLGKPDQEVAREYLASREIEEIDNPEIEQLISKAQKKIAEAT